MKRSIFRPASVYNPPIPFPMPDPQRGQAMKILIAEARAANVPPAMLVTHLPDSEKAKFTTMRVLVMKRIYQEVEGVSIKMLSRAFRRDHRRIKELLERATDRASGGGNVDVEARLIAQCKCSRAIREHGKDGCTEPDFGIHRACPECGKPWSKFLPKNAEVMASLPLPRSENSTKH